MNTSNTGKPNIAETKYEKDDIKEDETSNEKIPEMKINWDEIKNELNKYGLTMDVIYGLLLLLGLLIMTIIYKLKIEKKYNNSDDYSEDYPDEYSNNSNEYI